MLTDFFIDMDKIDVDKCSYDTLSPLLYRGIINNITNQKLLKRLLTLDSRMISHANHLDEDSSLYLINKFPYCLHRFKYPSPEVRMIAVTDYISCFVHINEEDRTEEMILYALSCFGGYIGIISDQKEIYQLAAIKNSRVALSIIKNPTKKAIALHKKIHKKTTYSSIINKKHIGGDI